MLIEAMYYLFKGDSTSLKKAVKEARGQVDDLRDSADDAEKKVIDLGKGFVELTENAAQAAAAILSFNAFKSGIIDANKFNSSLQVQAKLFGFSAVEANKYAKAVELAGGNSQAFLSNLAAVNQQRIQQGLQPISPGKFVESARGAIANSNDPNYRSLIASKYAGGDLGLQSFLLNDDVYKKAMADAAVSTKNADANMFDAARNLNEAAIKLQQTAETLSGRQGQGLNGVLSSLFGIGGGIENAAGSTTGGALGFGALGIGVASLAGKGLPWLLAYRLLKASKGAGIAGGAETGAAVGAGEGIAGVGAIAALIMAAAVAAAYEAASLLKAHPGGHSILGLGASWIKRQFVGDASAAETHASVSGGSIGFWMSKGYSRAQAAGLAANEQAESGGNPRARGDNGQAYGLFQWHLPRVLSIMRGTGIDVRSASRDQQLQAAAWELQQMGLDSHLRQIQGADTAAAFLTKNFERPADIAGESVRRGRMALAMADSSPGAISGGGGRDITVRIDKVEINTQAHDAAGMARDAAPSLISQIRAAIGSYDDGVLA